MLIIRIERFVYRRLRTPPASIRRGCGWPPPLSWMPPLQQCVLPSDRRRVCLTAGAAPSGGTRRGCSGETRVF